MNLVVLNPNARGGKARQVWRRLAPTLLEYFDELLVVVTHHPQEVARHIDKARAVGP